MTELERTLITALKEVVEISEEETSRVMGRVRRRATDGLIEAKDVLETRQRVADQRATEVAQ